LDWYLVSPELSLCVLAVVVILLDLVVEKKSVLAVVSGVGLIVPLILSITLWGENDSAFTWDIGGEEVGMLAVDNFAVFFKVLFLGITAMVIMSSWEYVTAKLNRFRGEFYALILLSALGLMIMAAAREMITIYVALELSGMSLYALVAMLKDRKSVEAGIKYILLGAIASAVLLYGMVIIFGLTGTTHLETISNTIAEEGFREPALMVGLGLIAAGFAFKISAVPFHMWAPDVYEGAPTPITAYLSVASKAAGFAVLLRIFFTAFGTPQWLYEDWSLLFGILAVISMTVGNILALHQTNIKRLLAYSGVAQAGYILVGLAAANSAGQSGVMFYLAVYALANLGAFITVIAITNRTGSDEISQFSGMIRRAPMLALVLAVCLISLAGIPPTAGFIGKLVVFKSAIDEGYLWLVIFGVINSVVAAFYYFKVIKVMFLGESFARDGVPSSTPLRYALAVSTIGVFVLGIYPYLLLNVADKAAALGP